MDQHKLDTLDFTIDSFETTTPQNLSTGRGLDCTGCMSGCGIFPEPDQL